MTETSDHVTLMVRCKPWSDEGVKENRVRVSGTVVTVWDAVAGHYTRCHNLSAATQRRIVKLANR